MRVRDLVLVRLHPDNPEKTYELIDVPILSREMNELFDLKREEILQNKNENKQVKNEIKTIPLV